MADAGFSMQLVIMPVIIAGIIMLTKIRLEAVSETEKNKEQAPKKREIIED